jgi:hypothetical protein
MTRPQAPSFAFCSIIHLHFAQFMLNIPMIKETTISQRLDGVFVVPITALSARAFVPLVWTYSPYL